MLSSRTLVWLTWLSLVVVVILFVTERYLHIQVPQCRYQMADPRMYPYKAGDIFLSSASFINRMMARCIWGHVGMVYRDPQSSLLYVWEIQIPHQGTWSTLTSSLKQPGCKLTPLFRYLRRARYPVALRSLSQEVDPVRFAQWVKHKWQAPFDFGFLTTGANRVFEGLVNVPVVQRSHQSGRYCAELIAETMEHLGVLDYQNTTDINHRTDSVIPGDFSEAHERLPWRRDPTVSNKTQQWSLGPEILVGTRPSS